MVASRNYHPTLDWPCSPHTLPLYEWTPSLEGKDDLECSIDDTNDVAQKERIWGGGLNSLLGGEDERLPEEDNFDLGLGLDSPDIQRWADVAGWSELTNKIEELDY